MENFSVAALLAVGSGSGAADRVITALFLEIMAAWGWYEDWD